LSGKNTNDFLYRTFAIAQTIQPVSAKCKAMTIKISKTATKEELAAQLRQLKPAKKLDVSKYAGKVKWGQDALDYQRELRDE